uniref:Outer membrane protein n=1 Tax=Caenorhabditis tropicalis TaxID=1561998 RepID=A0A1I7TTP9_9PELO
MQRISSEFSTYKFTLEVGKIATIDGQYAMSTLGSQENCNIRSGNCQTDDEYGNYERIQSAEAIISQKNIAIKEMNICSTFDTDLRRLQDDLEGCNIQQRYITDDGYLIEFPKIDSKETLKKIGPAGTNFEVDIGEPFITPIIRRIYGSDSQMTLQAIRTAQYGARQDICRAAQDRPGKIKKALLEKEFSQSDSKAL